MIKFNPLTRIRLLALGLVLVTGLFMIRLFYLQAVKGEDYAIVADSQYLEPVIKPFDRGTIFFTNKDGSLFSAATVKSGYKISLNPLLIEDPEKVYQALKTVLPLDHETFIYKASKEGDADEVVASRLPAETAEAVKRLGLRGVFVVKEKWRFYPGETLASHVLGFMAYRGDEYVGRYGLEKEYEQLLSRSEAPSFSQFFAQLFLGIGGGLFSEVRGTEGDLILTLEPTVQNFLEGELKKLVSTYEAEQAGGIIMDPQSGELYALGAFPNFHPGEKQGDIAVLPNPLVERVFEMGSIVKPLTMAAALDAGVVKPETTYYDAGSIKVGIATIKNFDGEARGLVNMQRVLNESLNTGAVYAMQQLGRERFRRYFMAFGIGEKTGVELPGEVAGLINNFRSTREVEYATASFGQGFAVTPLAMTRALAALGNGGYLPPPHLVREERYLDGGSLTSSYPVGRRVISAETSEEITRMLVKVVDEALRGGSVKMNHYRIAAKTGTAQVARPEGGYYDDRYLHSFFGYFPAYEPRFIVFFYLLNPRGVRYSSETLTTPFMDTAKFLINYYNIPPDR